MEDESRVGVLRGKVELLAWLIERECKCDRAKCAEHFRYMEQLKFQYECEIDDYESNIEGSAESGA